MQKTVQELIFMYENGLGNLPKHLINKSVGKLYTDQSTQREFIYNNIHTVDEFDNDITKAGLVINSILEDDIQLPALYFWNIQDDEVGKHFADNEFNIHDGKQRFLSIYNFIRTGTVTTRINGVEKTFGGLDEEIQQKLLNYTFDIVERRGTYKQEERSFFKINTTGEPLTTYEGLRGAYHGKFLYEFEKFLDNYHDEKIKQVRINRGEQALWFLYLYLGLINEENKFLLQNAKRMLEILRFEEFDKDRNNFAKKIELYCEFCALKKVSGNDSDIRKNCQIVDFIINNNFDSDLILDYYRKGYKGINDINKWSFEDEHKIAILNLINNGIRCDYRRFFNDEEKSQLYSKSNRCAKCNEVKDYNKLQIDHYLPWSKGGRTELSNAQLFCISCNSAMGANYKKGK